MSFVETTTFLGKTIRQKTVDSTSPVIYALPDCRYGHQRQLRISGNRARILSINVSQGIYDTRAYMQGEDINVYGGVTLRRGRFMTRTISWEG